jgi:hypothetical protein
MGIIPKVGDVIEIIDMVGEPQYCGKTGIVRGVSIDPWGETKIDGTWGGCSLYAEKDSYRIINNRKEDNV